MREFRRKLFDVNYHRRRKEQPTPTDMAQGRGPEQRSGLTKDHASGPDVNPKENNYTQHPRRHCYGRGGGGTAQARKNKKKLDKASPKRLQGTSSKHLIGRVKRKDSSSRWLNRPRASERQSEEAAQSSTSVDQIGYALCHNREEMTAKNAARDWKRICPPTNPRQEREMKFEFREKSEPGRRSSVMDTHGGLRVGLQ